MSVHRMHITLDAERDGYYRGPTPSRGGRYRCPICGGRSRSKKEHNADGNCSLLEVGVSAYRAPQPQRAWFGETTTED